MLTHSIVSVSPIVVGDCQASTGRGTRIDNDGTAIDLGIGAAPRDAVAKPEAAIKVAETRILATEIPAPNVRIIAEINLQTFRRRNPEL